MATNKKQPPKAKAAEHKSRKPASAPAKAKAHAQVKPAAVKATAMNSKPKAHVPAANAVTLNSHSQPKAANAVPNPFMKKQKERLLQLRDNMLDSMAGVSKDTLRSRAEGSEASVELGLFPIGESLAYAFARKGSLACSWVRLRARLRHHRGGAGADRHRGRGRQGRGEGGAIPSTRKRRESYALGLRLTVALSVGMAVVIGVFRILKGWPIQWFIIAGYIGVVIMTAFAPPEIIGIAYDSGGVTTSTVTVPLLTALGVGLAQTIRGRNPMIDGFGLIAFASLTPMIFVMAYGMLVHG